MVWSPKEATTPLACGCLLAPTCRPPRSGLVVLRFVPASPFTQAFLIAVRPSPPTRERLPWIKRVPARTWFSLAGVSGLCILLVTAYLDLPDLSKVSQEAESKVAVVRNRGYVLLICSAAAVLLFVSLGIWRWFCGRSGKKA